MKHKLFIFALLLATACSNLTGPQANLPITTEYRQWWNEIEACSGLRRNIETVYFVRVESIHNGGALGLTLEGPVRTIFLTPRVLHIEWIVKHEMIHAHGIVGHPAHYFNGVCGNLLPEPGREPQG